MSDTQRANLLILIQFLLFAAMGAALLLFPRQSGDLFLLIGIVLIGIGLLVFALAVYQHGAANRALPNISPEPNQSVGLVESGIYGLIRHPIYTGVLSVGWGLGIGHGHFAPLTIALLLTIFFTYKSRFEEKMLTNVYPQYSDYKQRAGRFLPKLIHTGRAKSP